MGLKPKTTTVDEELRALEDEIMQDKQPDIVLDEDFDDGPEAREEFEHFVSEGAPF